MNAKKIDLSNLGITDISPYALKKYNNLRALNMSNNTNFDFPKKSTFLYSRYLRYYFCNGCGIRVIYEETFKGLPILSTVELKGNNIQIIMPEAFYFVSQISIINLEDNQIEKFNSKGFLKFPPSFHSLTMNNNNNFQLPVNKEFLDAEKLTSFECNFCNIQEIFHESFSLVPEIVNIELQNNNMNRIDFNAFENNNKLDYLCLDNNHLSENNFNFTSKTLQQVYCSNCSFEKIKENTFSNFENLIKLKMRNNKISFIEEDSFKKNQKLKLIDLGSNQLQEFQINLIKDVVHLKTLAIDARDLCPKYDIQQLKKVYEERKLIGTDFNFEIIDNLAGNVLHKNCPKVDYIETGTTVDLSNLDITYIDPDFIGSNLTVLQMNDNRNFKFPINKSFLHNEHLEEYQCKGCGIVEITSKTFERLPKLIKIDLSNNHMKIVSYKAFRHNINLQDLFLADNNLSYLNDMIFQSNDKLSKLDLSNNLNFFKFPQSNSLQILNMSHCRMKELSYTNLGNLRILDLSFNEISSIDEHIFQKRLEELYLDFNKIEKFPSEFLKNSNLTKLCLDQNSFSFNYNEDMILFKEIYNERNLRSQAKCLASRNKEYTKFEDNILGRTTTTTTTTSLPITIPSTTKTIIRKMANLQAAPTDNTSFENVGESHDNSRNRTDKRDTKSITTTNPSTDIIQNETDVNTEMPSENTLASAGFHKNGQCTINGNSIMLSMLIVSFMYTFE